MLDSQLEVTDKIGYFLLKKGIIDDDILEKALEIKQDDQSKKKRNLAQILVHELKFDHEKLNVNGGAIALGHPLGMSGARIALSAMDQLQRDGGKLALCTMCIGVGQGIALVMESVG